MLARSKLNSIETLISQALIDSDISHEEYTTIIYEEEKCRRLKEDVRPMRRLRSDAEKGWLIEERKQIGINKVIMHNRSIWRRKYGNSIQRFMLQTWSLFSWLQACKK